MSSTGRTPVTTFPTNKRKLSNVQEFNTFETPGGPLAQRVPLASSRVTRLPEQPLDRTLGFRMENQEIGQNLLLKGQPLYVVASPPKGPSPYNFQNQRNPFLEYEVRFSIQCQIGKEMIKMQIRMLWESQ